MPAKLRRSRKVKEKNHKFIAPVAKQRSGGDHAKAFSRLIDDAIFGVNKK